jgi:hypothetical protein
MLRWRRPRKFANSVSNLLDARQMRIAGRAHGGSGARAVFSVTNLPGIIVYIHRQSGLNTVVASYSRFVHYIARKQDCVLGPVENSHAQT